MSKSRLSVVIPAYNEESNIPALLERLRKVVHSLQEIETEIILVDDHSSDQTPHIIAAEHQKDPRVKLLRLSRNSGSHIALQAGLSRASGDFAVTLSADLQDPPEIIPSMLEKVREGKDVVWAVRQSRKDGWWPRFRSSLSHRFFKKFILPSYPQKGTDHFMVSHRALEALQKSPEKNTHLMALVCWMGFEQDQVFFERDQRLHGSSKWTFNKTFKLIVDSFISFSYLPVRFMSFLGFIMAAFGFLYILTLIFRYLFLDIRGTPGWYSLMVMIVFVSGIQMMMLGILGEYIWRIFEEVRHRPLYIIEKSVGFEGASLTEKK